MNNDDPLTNEKSKSQRKREMTALQELGEELVALRLPQLNRLELPEALLDAVLAAQAIRQHGARKRQLQYIGKVMRDVEAAPIRAALDAVANPGRQADAQLHLLENWRDRLLANGDAALEEFIAHYAHADRSRLRTLVRSAHTGSTTDQAPRAARALFRYLRELVTDPM